MSTEERLRAMEMIWNSLQKEEAQLDSPSWHAEVLEERRSKIDQGQAEFVSLDEAKKLLEE
ncbi:addiction module protein [Puniceicoccus vermicola]|uniref:Addiction module protein n=1 Tax=Puniceicoccus vermicola TaxID=388746 RepID=A0A7X1E4W9_9BACT|nr:addiction module protein [Puniceicoccus vermicola]MBC2602990.1 addiction module protein [Puniceicoccus vermicola]